MAGLKATHVYAALAFFIIGLSIVVLPRAAYIFSDMLLLDDSIYVSAMALGTPVSDDGTLLFDFIGVAVQLFGVAGARLVVAAFAVTAVGLLALTSVRYGRAAPLSAALVAGVALTIPVSAMQFVFIDGSHPTWAMPFVAFGVFSAFAALAAGRAAAKMLWSGAGVAAFLLAQQMSPTVPLVSLGVLGLLILPPLTMARAAPTLFIGIGPVAFYAASFLLRPDSRNHYTGVEGWLSYDLGHLARRPFEIVGYVWRTTFDWGPGLLVAFLALSAVAIGAVMATSRRAGSEAAPRAAREDWLDSSLAFAVVCVLTAAFAVAPVLALTRDAPRYFEVPTAFFAFGVLSLAFRATRARPLPWARGLAAVLVAFAAADLWHGRGVIGAALDEPLVMAKRLKRLVQDEGPRWAPDAQVVVYGRRPVGSGNNHWSTWYLRYLARRPDIIGLVGAQRQMTRDPVVEEFVRNGADYWSTDDTGRARRLKMIGIEDDRPTYVYELVDDAFQERRYVIIDRPGGRVTLARAAGGLIRDGVTGRADDICAQADSPDALRDAAVWSRPYPVTPREVSGRTLEFNGAEEVRVRPEAAHGVLEWAADLHPEMPDLERAANGATYPPMPVRWGDFTIRQRDASTFEITVADRYILWDARPNEAVPVSLSARDGCYAEISIGDRALRAWGWSIPDQTMQLGRGHMDRYWTGAISLAN